MQITSTRNFMQYEGIWDYANHQWLYKIMHFDIMQKDGSNIMQIETPPLKRMSKTTLKVQFRFDAAAIAAALNLWVVLVLGC